MDQLLSKFYWDNQVFTNYGDYERLFYQEEAIKNISKLNNSTTKYEHFYNVITLSWLNLIILKDYL